MGGEEQGGGLPRLQGSQGAALVFGQVAAGQEAVEKVLYQWMLHGFSVKDDELRRLTAVESV
jgi:hypothetical protein